MCGKRNAILGKVGQCFWSVNVPKSNKGQNRAANIILTSDPTSRTSLYTLRKCYTVDVLVVDTSFVSITCNPIN